MSFLMSELMQTSEGKRDLILNHTIIALTAELHSGALLRDSGFEGLWLVPTAFIENDDNNMVERTQITKAWIEDTGLSECKIWNAASDRLVREAVLLSMFDMNVVTTRNYVLGAGAITTFKVAGELFRKYGEAEYIVQPSSVHEIILRNTQDYDASLEWASETVRRINADNEVAYPTDRLIDRAYKIRITAPGIMEVLA